MRRFDSQLGQSLEMLAAAHRAWQAGGRSSAEVLVDGQPIKDLCLTFVLPGGPCISPLPAPGAMQLAPPSYNSHGALKRNINNKD